MSDTLTWDWREQPDLDRLAEILARYGVRLEQVDTGADQIEVRISGNPLAAADRALAALDQAPLPERLAIVGEEQAAAPILGRALVGHFGAPVLIETEDGNWGSAFVRPVPRAAAVEMFAAREVLLVSPVAGEVLKAAKRLVSAWDVDPFSPLTAAAKAALAVAVDAMVGGHPAEPTPSVRDEALREALREDAEVDALERDRDQEAEEVLAAFECGEKGVAGAPASGPTLTDQDATETTCRCGRMRVTASFDAGGLDGAPAWSIRVDPAPSSVAADLTSLPPEPDSGTGWDRETINSICRDDLGEPHPRTAQVRALLADRDVQASDAVALRRQLRRAESGQRYAEEGRNATGRKLGEVSIELERVRAELAEVTADRNRLRQEHRRFAAELGFGDDVTEPAATLADMLDPVRDAIAAAAEHDECPVHCELCGERLAATLCERCGGSGDIGSGAYSECPECAGVGRIHVGCPQKSVADLVAEVERLRGDLDEYRATFELGFRRMGEAVALRRAEAPQEREPTQPDLGDILKWLMDRAASAYREGAADALEWLAGDALCADDRRQAVRDVAAAMLAGEWTVPARTEEAIPDGE